MVGLENFRIKSQDPWARVGQAFLLIFQLSLDDFQLQPPVTFRLKSGSGPVRITGRHQIGEKSGPSHQASLHSHYRLTPTPSPSVSRIPVLGAVHCPTQAYELLYPAPGAQLQ